jgi:Carboxypeptidase regulatory-like domain
MLKKLTMFIQTRRQAWSLVPAAAAWTTILVVLWATFAMAPAIVAQTATAGAVVGVVTDPTGAVVPKAEVKLVNLETNATSTQSTNNSGEYVFPNATPGNYKITVTLAGFRTVSVPNLTVQVNKSLNQPIQLEVGGGTQVVEVSATATAELQTTDAQIGNVITHDALLRLPTFSRSVTELLGIQPGVVPAASGAGSGIAMRASGAIDDQNTVTVDGIDVTQSVVAGNTVVPIPTDSVQEFRMNVANANSNFDRASGGQMALIGRRGTNTLHGTAYAYFENDVLNANTWDSNHAGIGKPAIDDKRFGGSLGGPIIKDKTFIFGHYEGRRFDSTSQVTRTVPTDLLKQGILQFRDASSNVQRFNLASAAVCGSGGNTLCDPRGLGLSPTVKAEWALMPAGNVTGGDGLNTTGYLANIGTPIQDDYGRLALDHNFNSKLVFNGSYTYFRHIATGAGEIAIVNGQPQSLITTPQRGAVVSGGLTWQISPTLLNVFRFGYVKDTNAGQALTPQQAAGRLALPGTSTSGGPVAILVGSGVSSFIDSPIDMDTQRARYQENWNKDIQFLDDMTWIRGSHTMSFGAQVHALPYTHARADKVVGSLSSLLATVDSGNFLQIPAVNRPATCGASIGTNCLQANDLSNWNRYYASALGMIDNVNILAARDSKLNPLPFGTNLINHTNEFATYFYWQDTWRVKRSFTLTFGLSYGWQTSPTEDEGKQTVQIDASTGQLISAVPYLQAKEQAALKGQIYNPTMGWVPVNLAHHPVFNVDWGNVAPRAAFAWNPSFGKGFMGHLLGDRKTVLRGGFGLFYDRSNTVQSVEIPMLGVGFGQNINITTPACNLSGTGGAGCNGAVGSSNPGLSSFRVGVDGAIPLPAFGTMSSPVIPGPQPYAETLSFQVDPNTKIGRSYSVDLSIQRELPGSMVLEAAYVGRFARHLPQAVNLTAAPYMFTDPASGQSFAQAFDNVATALRNSQPAPVQPWFENQLPGLAAQKGAANATAYVVAQNAGNFTGGQVFSIFQNLGTYRRGLNLQPYSNDESQIEFMRTYIGSSNYNGLLVTLNKRFSHGLNFSFNYTFSKALDDDVTNQNNAGYYPNNYHLGTEYGPSPFDRTHTISAFYRYDLPAGKGHRLGTGNWFDRVIGGWSTSGIFTAWTGVPLVVVESGQVWGDAPNVITANTGLIPVNGVPSTGLNSGVGGSNGVGTNAALKTGSGMSLFADPSAAFNSFRPVLLSQDTRAGRGNPLRGLPYKNIDMSLQKETKITERVLTRFSADFFNIFNHPNFANPGLSYTNKAAFGVITGTYNPPGRTNGARWIELGIRVEF